MVKTLFKYEFKAYARTILPMQGIIIVIALLNRLIQFAESDDVSYRITFNSSLVALIISMIVLCVFTLIFGVTRYYKNMFSHEGYLTLTLPVTSSEHIIVKVVTFFVFTVLTAISLLVAGCVASMGDMLFEVCRAIGYLVNRAFANHGVHFILYCIEIFFILVITVFYNYLLFYGCMTLGQTARKNRVLCSFGIYFAYYFVTQILATVVMLFVINTPDMVEDVIAFSFDHEYAFFHILFCTVIVVMSALCVGLYALTDHILKYKLNIE